MSMNKFMHPRNRYRKPPDFKALAIKYPEFRKYAQQDIAGKVSFNFKDLEALRVLTSTLLQEDFSLVVEIPLNRLIPTLPLRLNYLLWIEDLLESNKRISDVIGIDIGCGASCVYPLLAAKQFGWRMLATELDMDSAFIAGRNVKKNKLQQMIKVRSVDKNQMLDGVLEPNTTYDFCMCNPPFFSSEDELDPKNVSRSESRPAPRNAHSGTSTELVAPGGEIAFITGIIRDSTKLKDAIRIYSVMVGHKSSVGKVKQALQDASIAAVVTSEFCQGRTTRWGVAWTLDPTITLPQIENKKKKATSFSQTFKSDLTSTVDRLKKLLEDLQMTYKFLKSTQDLYAIEITAAQNTWGNSRRKKRQEKFKQKTIEGVGNEKGNSEQNVKEISEVDSTNSNEGETSKIDDGSESKGKKENGTKIAKDERSIQEVVEEDKIEKDESEGSTNEVMKGSKRCLVDDEVSSTSDSNLAKKPKLENPASGSNPVGHSRKDPILHGSLVVRGQGEGSSVEMIWLNGTGGREAAHQVLQYIKNEFEPH